MCWKRVAGKASSQPQQIDFGFYVDWTSETSDGPGLVSITSASAARRSTSWWPSS